MTYAPHQKRVIDEKAELDLRRKDLRDFVDKNPVFKTLPPEEKFRLNAQQFVMAEYSDILGERIAAFITPNQTTMTPLEPIIICGLTERQIESIIMSLPRDSNGEPINPASEYVTMDGTPCRARIIVDFGVSVTQGNIWRSCTTADVMLRYKEEPQ